jgi:hypothetical protein
VKSAHEISIAQGGRVSPFFVDTWKSVWGLKIQARLKHHLWKIAWDMLPSRANIGRFIISEDMEAWVCPFCKNSLETLSHIFLECDLDRILWRSSSWPLFPSTFASRHISDWILAIIFPVMMLAIPKYEVRKFQLFASLTLDFIWMARNKLIHNGIQPCLAKAIKQISYTLGLHCQAWSDSILPSIWTPPFAGCIKGNFDVVAAVISDENGNIILAFTQKLSYSDALLGEASAAHLTSQLATSSGCGNLFLEGDALLVILAISNPHLFSSWSFANCISDISLVLSSFHSWNALKVSRSANF